MLNLSQLIKQVYKNEISSIDLSQQILDYSKFKRIRSLEHEHTKSITLYNLSDKAFASVSLEDNNYLIYIWDAKSKQCVNTAIIKRTVMRLPEPPLLTLLNKKFLVIRENKPLSAGERGVIYFYNLDTNDYKSIETKYRRKIRGPQDFQGLSNGELFVDGEIINPDTGIQISRIVPQRIAEMERCRNHSQNEVTFDGCINDEYLVESSRDYYYTNLPQNSSQRAAKSNGFTRLVNVNTGERKGILPHDIFEFHPVKRAKKVFRTVSVNEDLLLADDGSSIQYFDIITGKQFFERVSEGRASAFLADCNAVIVRKTGTLCLYNIIAQNEIVTLDCPDADTTRRKARAFSSKESLISLHDGTVITKCSDRVMHLWGTDSYRYLDLEEIRVVLEQLRYNTSVTELNLSGIKLDEKTVRKIADLLLVNNSIKEINLSNTGLNDIYAKFLLISIKQISYLKKLIAVDNPMSQLLCETLQAYPLYMQGRDLSDKDHDKNSLLHIAAREGHFTFVQHLIKSENIDAVNYEEKTSLDLARENQHQEIVDFLEEQISIKKHPKKVEQLQEEQANLSRTVEAKFKQQESTHKKLATGLKTQIDQQIGKMQADQSRFNQKVTQKIETIESQQQVLQEQLTTKVTEQIDVVQTQQKKYAEKTIEQAIEARDWLLFKTLVKAKADLRCINCIPYLEELQAQDLTIEVLQQCGGICDLTQLQTTTKDMLFRIETHPEEVKYLQRLYAAWQELIEGCQHDTLKNSTVAHQINANALTKLITVWYEGQLLVILQEKVQTYLYSSSIKRHQQWLQNRLPETIQQQLDQKISKVLWEQWKTQRHNDFPAQEQLAQNVLIVFKEHYKKQQLSKILTTAIDRKIIAEVIEQIKTNSLPKVLAETLQPIADQLSQGKLITNMLPIYEQAMQQLINQWKSDELTEPTAAIIDGLATKVIAEIHPEPKLREQLDEEAVQLLLAQLKQNQLPEEVQSPLIQQTQDTISHLKPTEGQLNQALNKLLIEYKTNKTEFSQEEQSFLEDVILGEWKQLMEQLKMYAYPVTLVGEVKELRMENRELKQQLEIQQQTQESKIVQIQKQMESMMQQLQMSQQPEEPTTNMKFFNK